MRQYDLALPPNGAFDQAPSPFRSFGNVVARSVGDPAALAGSLRAVLRTLDPELPVEVQTLPDLVAGSASEPRFRVLLVSAFAAVALVLSMIGLHGVLWRSVAERRRELGLRLALGGRPRDVSGLVLAEGGRLIALGLALGTLGAGLLSRLAASLLFGVQPLDPLTYGLVAALVGLVAFGALALPALRAARLDPAETLREQ